MARSNARKKGLRLAAAAAPPSTDGRPNEQEPRGLPYGAALPADRAFVVHFASGGGLRRRFIGRVEHLSTAEVAPFSSLQALLDFFERLAFAQQ